MVQPVPCLPHKHEGLSWIPNTHLKELSSAMHTVTPAIVGPWGLLASSLGSGRDSVFARQSRN